MIRTRVLRAAFLLLSCSSFAAAFQQSIAGSRWFSRSARHSPSRLLAKEESEENFWTLLNPFSQAPSATKREKEEYKRAEKGSTPKTTAESKYHMGERKKFSFGSDAAFEINAYKKQKEEEEGSVKK